MVNRDSFVGYGRWIISALFSLLPFTAILVSDSMFFPFITGKNFAFRIIVEIAAVIWVGLMVADKRFRPRFTIMSGALIAVVAITFIADILAVDSQKAFFSNYERMEGFITTAHLALFFLIAASIFRSRRQWSVILNTFVLSGVIVSLYGVLQKFGIFKIFQSDFRISATIGNAAYLAAYLVLTATIALYLLFEEENILGRPTRSRRIYYLGSALLMLGVIYLTATRGAMLGVVAGLIVFSVLYLFLSRKIISYSPRLKKAALWFLVIAAVLPVGLRLMRETDFVKNNPVLVRYANISTSEAGPRLMVWRMAWEGAKERPLFGWGQEGFIHVFTKYYNPQMFDKEPWFDRTHNMVFDWLIATGFLGVLAYLFFCGAAVWTALYSTIKKIFPPEGVLIIVGGLTAYFIQNLFVFDNLNTYLAFFAITAMIHERAASAKSTKDVSAEAGRSDFGLAAAGIAFVALLYPFYVWNVKPIQQSQTLIAALSTPSRMPGASTEQVVMAVRNNFEKALAYNTFGNGETIEQLGQTALNLLSDPGNLIPAQKEFIVYAIGEAEKHLDQSPFDPRMRLFLATVYNRALGIDPEYVDKAETHIKKFIGMSPKRQLGYLALAEHYLNLGMPDEAFAAARTAVELAPEFDSVWAALIQLAVAARAHNVVDEILRSNASDEVVGRAALSYSAIEDYGRARILYEEMLKRYPTSIEYLSRLADIYVALGLYDAAIARAKKLAEIDPNQFGEKAALFIKQIEALR